jgi:hypothetical protein
MFWDACADFPRAAGKLGFEIRFEASVAGDTPAATDSEFPASRIN